MFFHTEDVEGVYSATEKAVIRNHVSYICRKQHCADTLALYLNSPTRSDGTMLLWDANLNGIVRGSHLHVCLQVLLVMSISYIFYSTANVCYEMLASTQCAYHTYLSLARNVSPKNWVVHMGSLIVFPSLCWWVQSVPQGLKKL